MLNEIFLVVRLFVYSETLISFFIKESSQNFFHWNWNFTGETGINSTQVRRFEKMEKSAIVEKPKRRTYRLTAEFKEKNNSKIVELKWRETLSDYELMADDHYPRATYGSLENVTLVIGLGRVAIQIINWIMVYR